jgi:DNA-binding response OmpR family regulator
VIRVLIAEDDAGIRQMLRSFLTVNGFTVVTAGDGREALDLLAEAAPDVLLTDHEMPRLSGAELVHALRKLPAWKDLPVIMLTAFARKPAVDALRNLPRVEIIDKPPHFRELPDRLRAIVGAAGAGDDSAAAPSLKVRPQPA